LLFVSACTGKSEILAQQKLSSALKILVLLATGSESCPTTRKREAPERKGTEKVAAGRREAST